MFKHMSLSKDLYLFSYLLNYSFGFLTVEQIRDLFVHSTRNHDDYPVSSSKVVLEKEFSRVLGTAINGMLYFHVKELSNFANSVALLLKPLKVNIDQFRSLPIFSAIRNNIKTLSDQQLQNYFSGSSNFIPPEVLKENLLLLDLESLASFSRRQYTFVIKAAKLCRIMKKNLNFDPFEEMHRMRSLQVMKAMTDLVQHLDRF